MRFATRTEAEEMMRQKKRHLSITGCLTAAVLLATILVLAFPMALNCQRKKVLNRELDRIQSELADHPELPIEAICTNRLYPDPWRSAAFRCEPVAQVGIPSGWRIVLRYYETYELGEAGRPKLGVGATAILTQHPDGRREFFF